MKHDTEHGGGGGGSTAAPTLADVQAYIEAKSNLPATRRRDLRSSIKIVARVLDREPAVIPALPSRLREEFAKVLPAAHGISSKPGRPCAPTPCRQLNYPALSRWCAPRATP